MSRVSVAVDALNNLLSVLEGISRFTGLVRSVQSSVKKAAEQPEVVEAVKDAVTEAVVEEVADVVKNKVDKAALKVKDAVDQFDLPFLGTNKK